MEPKLHSNNQVTDHRSYWFTVEAPAIISDGTSEMNEISVIVESEVL